VDELNKLFTSNKLEDLYEFYSHFSTAEELIKWMRERPKAEPKFFHVQGKRKIVVVVPTKDHEGELAKNIKDIFKGLHIIFVESSGPYFNYAYSVNRGMEEALTLDPQWIVLSNDDEYKIDEVSVLEKELEKVNSPVVFTQEGRYHSFYVCISKYRWVVERYRHVIYRFKKGVFPVLHKIRKKFNIKYFVCQKKGEIHRGRRRFYHIHETCFKNIGSFGIFSSNFVEKGDIFDDTFINGYEDVWLSFSLKDKECPVINYRIEDDIGKSLGKEELRSLRDIVNLVYFHKLIQKFIS